ncbi:pyruvate/2-oxoglutarate dehydrogenase complex dihydrolipoamide dehydrogenase (E3) component [Brachybacterium muris]|uniref:NAD(P)/FAD-dependent oxidoreductase n=1 Tax=Brachybacterium muris TaxID=219301 RepID=UPI0021A725EF|nr:pyruvate/2-oxoglutarate dehydrogenase complex dihydrolipoamide dehydrogenase (E3) component [Brachybacterium muris]MCT1431723.1 NAD(P)/FAD-dependent oxidoreductase [Brachybacterium muris]
MLVIGWGKGGKTFAGAMAGAGRSVASVEQSSAMYGGTCINIGCVPTKTLIHDAAQRRDGDDAAEFFRKAVDRRDTLIAKLNDVNLHMLADRDTVTVVDGRARIVGPHEVEVTPSAGGSGLAEHLLISADTVVINTGAVPVLPPLPGVDGPRIHTSTSIQHVDPFPRRLAVVGAGPIGLEFASMFRDFGSEVTVLARGERILPDEDQDVASGVHELLTEAGIDLRTQVDVTSLEDGTDAVTVHMDTPEGPWQLQADAVLMATGRRPATEDLGLEQAGIETDERGTVVVDAQLRTSAEGVFAMGDVHGGQQQTYLSLDDHRVVLDALTGSGTRRTDDRVAVPATTFLDPPMSSVGIGAEQARSEGLDVRTVMVPVAGIKAMPRPKAVGDPRGFIKIVVDSSTDQLLGARLLHVDSQEVINLLALAMRAGVTASELRDGIWTHPSSTEALNEVLAQLS